MLKLGQEIEDLGRLRRPFLVLNALVENNLLLVLQRLKDEKCARLFATSDLTAKDVRKLESCTQDLPWIHTDAKGNYSFTNLGPGSYQVREVLQGGFRQTTSDPASVTSTSGGNVTVEQTVNSP